MARLTDEEKIARQLAQAVTNVSLDLDLVGLYLARAYPRVVFHRLQIVAEAAEYERNSVKNVREYWDDF